METKDLDSWEEFEKTISTFFSNWQKLKDEKPRGYVSSPLFRGQADASWKLETTLERSGKHKFSASEYHKRLRAVRPAVISITGKPWDIPDRFEPKRPPPGYEFMIYLRHHGFPSPLLDWTRSPFVAAYFAFRSAVRPKKRKVAIYAYIEYGGDGRTLGGGVPNVHGLGQYVVSHRRHYAQQCEYTICWKEDEEDGKDRVYSSHEDAFRNDNSLVDQGTLTKYMLPFGERAKVLKQLHRMNVTAFSLFGSEESLMETLAYEEIEVK